ncbi:TetR family transcriptional regulator [Kutzneria viridogrisea]|uniref:HTH tetR-type domain-containing protein n=2 Tax=Kutzneria TaxID=43356 RepID=W5WAF9_9PSEU|nr:TetR/AcrR family transcriptional regulator [Kutzneria albida]AHH97725.1 hypothetical protein KALB_4363 [Kutzneria albida DSM 43870]MBA8924689.1 AcrR family transcriptional regulator [Kutzneria viridogrisea]
MDPDLPLRERKKLQTRKHISDVATRLFVQHGFEAVTVAEVAAAAEVSKMTVFNYFSSKEDLIFDDLPLVARRVAQLVRDRPRGQSVVETFRQDFLASLEPHDLAEGVRRNSVLHPDTVHFWRTVQNSPALRARERESAEQMVEVVAEALGGTLADRLAAAQIGAVLGVLHGEIRRLLLAGQDSEQIRAVIVPAAESAFDTLARALN